MGVLRNVHDTPLGWVPSRELRDSGEARAGLGSRAHMRQLNPQLGGNADGWSVHTRGRTGTDAPATDVVAGVGHEDPPVGDAILHITVEVVQALSDPSNPASRLIGTWGW